jgi:hypothetical protein
MMVVCRKNKVKLPLNLPDRFDKGAASWGTTLNINHRLHRFTQIIKKEYKKVSVICVICGFFFLIVSG